MVRRLTTAVSVAMLLGAFGAGPVNAAGAVECVQVQLPNPTGGVHQDMLICNDIPDGGPITIIDYIFIEIDPNVALEDIHVSLTIGGRGADISGAPGTTGGFQVTPPEGGGVCTPPLC